jgi:hypothetical protein
MQIQSTGQTNAGTGQQTRENNQEHVQSKEPKQKLKVRSSWRVHLFPQGLETGVIREASFSVDDDLAAGGTSRLSASRLKRRDWERSTARITRCGRKHGTPFSPPVQPDLQSWRWCPPSCHRIKGVRGGSGHWSKVCRVCTGRRREVVRVASESRRLGDGTGRQRWREMGDGRVRVVRKHRGGANHGERDVARWETGDRRETEVEGLEKKRSVLLLDEKKTGRAGVGWGKNRWKRMLTKINRRNASWWKMEHLRSF